MDSVPKINVVIRKRPLSRKEAANNDLDIVECQGRELIVKECVKQCHKFEFDNVEFF